VLIFPTVDAKMKQGSQRPLTPRQQRLLLRAAVGSLVLSAALTAPPVPASRALGRQGGGAQGSLPRVEAQPFRDLLAKMRQMAAAGEIGERDSFEFTVEAGREPGGALRDVRFTKSEASNQNWRRLTEEFVRLLSDSRALSYLEEVDRLTLTLKLGDRAVVTLAAEAPDEARAQRLGSFSEVLLNLAAHAQRGRAEAQVLNNMTASASGKRLLMKLDMSREEAGNLLRTHTAIP
jgi:hypothetical protein